MGTLNKAQIIGYLGRDAELRYTPAGHPVATINLATTDVWTDQSGKKNERTEWHRCVIWGKLAESLAQYLEKGKQVYAEGRIQTREWTDKDGIKRYTTEIRADRIVLLGKSGSGGGNFPPHPAEAEQAPAGVAAGGGDDDDSIPF